MYFNTKKLTKQKKVNIRVAESKNYYLNKNYKSREQVLKIQTWFPGLFFLIIFYSTVKIFSISSIILTVSFKHKIILL